MRKPVLLVAITVIVIFLINSCNTQPVEQKETAAAPSAEDNLKEGERLVAALDCEICHSPKRMGPKGPEVIPEFRFGGHQAGTQLPPIEEKALKSGWVLFAPDFTSFVGPWGQSYSGNISSDSTGIGMWTEDQFKKVIREGKFKGLDNTRPILPPMPWEAYKNLTDDEISKVFAFLKTTKPVKNVVPQAKINPPPKM
ncbi:MAG: c-type cytochrome [Chitinophagaceae bacterium]|nr:c-type cytochrome [Chitinophagaceae bacterium]